MPDLQVQEVTSQQDWNAALNSNGHPIQYWQWGELKSEGSWTATRLEVKKDNAPVAWAQLLTRPLPWPARGISYCSRGPLVSEGVSKTEVTRAIAKWVKNNLKSLSITFEPTWQDHEFSIPKDATNADLPVFLPDTIILDLEKTEEELFADFSKSLRKKIRKVNKMGLTVSRITAASTPMPEGSEVTLVPETEELLKEVVEIYHDTAGRADFGLHSDHYYLRFHELFGDRSLLTTISATPGGEPDAFLWIALGGGTAFELWGGMNEEANKLNLNTLLKWRTIQLCKDLGYKHYDLNGLLNSGVSAFKRTFAKHENHLVPAFTYALSPMYRVWMWLIFVARKGLQYKGHLLRRIKKH